MEATQYPNKATMQLSLTNAWSDGLKKHYIIHEFGHALGLGHEHQRSKFWQSLHPYVNLDKMKQDPDVGGDENFHINWAEEATGYYTSDAGEDSGEYDPQSIMHYGLVLLSNAYACECDNYTMLMLWSLVNKRMRLSLLVVRKVHLLGDVQLIENEKLAPPTIGMREHERYPSQQI